MSSRYIGFKVITSKQNLKINKILLGGEQKQTVTLLDTLVLKSNKEQVANVFQSVPVGLTDGNVQIKLRAASYLHVTNEKTSEKAWNAGIHYVK